MDKMAFNLLRPLGLVTLVVLSSLLLCSCGGSEGTVSTTEPQVLSSTAGRVPPVNDNIAALGNAYDRYLASIDKARAIIYASAGVRPGHEEEDQKEGELFLSSVINTSLTWALINTPDKPMMVLVPHPNDRLGFDNPDNFYYTARVADDRVYVVEGDRGLATTFTIQANLGLPGLSAAKGKTVDYINGSELITEEDGHYSILVSPQAEAKGNALTLEQGVDNLLVRFSFQDWEKEQQNPGTISIRTVGQEQPETLVVTPTVATTMLSEAATSIEQQAKFYSKHLALVKQAGVNKLIGPSKGDSEQATASHQWNVIGLFELEPDEAMVITIKAVTNALYHNLEAANPWLNTYEFIHHQSSLNSSQLVVDGDGYIRYVVSPSDPGVHNWIDTTGHTFGWIWCRWQEVNGEIGPEHTPRVEIVKRFELPSLLPTDTVYISPAERKAKLAHRAALLKQRFAGADPQLPELLRRLHTIENLLGHPLAHHTIDEAVD